MEAALHDIFIHTYNPNHDLRAKAETALQQFLLTPGSLTALINFIGTIEVHRELRQACGILLKNRLRDYFITETSTKALPSSPEEKEYVKHQFLNILLNELDNSIRGILAESVRVISDYEFPERWPTLVPTIIANIQNNDVLRIYNALLALRKLVKRYEYKAKEERKVLYDILSVALPCLQRLMQQILNENSLEAAQVMRLCFKVFWSSTVYVLPQVQGVDVNLWFQMIATIMNKRLPEASEGVEPVGQPTNPADRKTWPWWKLKKWTSRIMTHFIQRYGNPKYSSEEDKAFAEYFRSHTALTLLGPAMNNLVLKSQGAYFTDDVHRSCLTYLHNCAEMSPTYKLMKPHLQFILFQAVFPTLCMTKEDIELFNDDPQEFIRKVHNPISDWLSPMVAATNLLQTLARYRQGDVLPLFLPFLQNILEAYTVAPPQSKDYIQKDGVLVSIAVLAKIMLDSKTYRGTLIPFLQAHILPEFKSPVAFLRARACWVIEYFSELDWEQEANKHETHSVVSKKKSKSKSKKGEMSAGEILRAVLQCLIDGLKDPSLPVQAAAACSLQVLIEKEGATELLRPLLPQIISEYFRIMEEVDNESVLVALQGIVQQYGDEIANMAPTMVQHLVRKFGEYAQEGDDEEAAYNAAQCLDTIDSILQCLEDHEDVLREIEPILLPLLLQILNNCDQCFEYIDTAVHMISCYTYYYDGISVTMWTVCGPLLHALNEWALDYISEIMVPLLNYMTKGIEIFLNAEYNGQKVLSVMLQSLSKVYENTEGYSGKDYNSASNLLSCLLISCKDHPAGNLLQPYLPSILNLALEKLTMVRIKSVKIRLLEIIMSSFYYDATATLTIFASIQSTSIATKLSQDNQKPIEEYLNQPTTMALIFYFQILFDLLKDMERDFTERLIVLSFLAILTLPIQTLPPIIQINIPSMFQQVIRETIMIEDEAKKEREREDEDEDEEDDDDEEDDGDAIDFDEEDAAPPRRGKKDTSLRPDADDEDEDFDEKDPAKAEERRIRALYVPDGGYGEDEDCLNAEDEEYRKVLEDLTKEDRVKREAFMAGEPVDDEEDEDFIYTSPIENIPMAQLFVQFMNVVGQRDPQFASHYLKQSLNEEDHQRINELVQLAVEQQQQLQQFQQEQQHQQQSK